MYNCKCGDKKGFLLFAPQELCEMCRGFYPHCTSKWWGKRCVL